MVLSLLNHSFGFALKSPEATSKDFVGIVYLDQTNLIQANSFPSVVHLTSDSYAPKKLVYLLQ